MRNAKYTKTELAYRRNHTEAAIARKRKYFETNRDLIALRKRCNRYGINVEIFQIMLHKQGGKCKICLDQFGNSRAIKVDHNHVTGKVRGLLCTRCNTALGMAMESEFILARLVAYLRWSESVTPDVWQRAHFSDLPCPPSTS